MGKTAVANAKIAYAQFQEAFAGPRWQALAEGGAMVQRPLWASTSTKNPAYRDVIYVEELIGPDTVNTIPPDTLEAFRDHGEVGPTLLEDWSGAARQLEELTSLGIDLQLATEDLQREGLDKFAAPFDSLLATLRSKRDSLRAGVSESPTAE